ncbi:MAG: PD-(D/E)XK nuclease family protein [Cyanobium sp. MAG06]|nr:PD-(D/E)XK nuclease family protein [Cyanobium sp. MAG06]
MSIIDFKTGKNEESADSLQLFIYYYLLSRLQNTPIRDAYYLYLNNTAKESELVKYNIDDIKIDEKYYIDKLLSVANNILDCKKDNL